MNTEDRVQRGIELLDRVKPDWRAEIDIEDLDLCRIDLCVLGQVYGDYFLGLSALGLCDARDCSCDAPGAWRYGFSLENGGPEGSYQGLTELWVKELSQVLGA